MDDCIFCKIAKGEIPSIKVYEDEKVLAFEDINPISDGHTLIIPKRHAQNIWEIPGEDLVAIHQASQKVALGMREALNPTGIALLQLNGRGANQVVMHYHLHLVPRTSEDPEMSITTWKLKEGNMETIKQTAEKISNVLRLF